MHFGQQLQTYTSKWTFENALQNELLEYLLVVVSRGVTLYALPLRPRDRVGLTIAAVAEFMAGRFHTYSHGRGPRQDVFSRFLRTPDRTHSFLVGPSRLPQ